MSHNLFFLSGPIFPLCLLLFSHICADYLCQSKEFVRRKRNSNFYFLIHIFLVWLFAFLLFIPYRSGKAIAVVTTLAILHLIVDKTKIWLKKSRPEIGKKTLNIIDQVIHFLLILLAWRIFLFDLPTPSFFFKLTWFWHLLPIAIVILIIYTAITGLSEKEESE